MAKPNPDLQAATDARLSAAVEAANFRITLNNQKQNARLKLQNDLIIAVNGGIFSVTPELIAFANTLLQREKVDAILLDNNKNPIMIDDLSGFVDDLISLYYEHLNEFLVEFKSLQKSRTTKAVVGE